MKKVMTLFDYCHLISEGKLQEHSEQLFAVLSACVDTKT